MGVQKKSPFQDSRLPGSHVGWGRSNPAMLGVSPTPRPEPSKLETLADQPEEPEASPKGPKVWSLGYSKSRQYWNFGKLACQKQKLDGNLRLKNLMEKLWVVFKQYWETIFFLVTSKSILVLGGSEFVEVQSISAERFQHIAKELMKQVLQPWSRQW